MRDLVNNIDIVQALAPAVLTATATGAVINLLGFGSAAVAINTGAIAGDGDFTTALQESDTTTSSDFADVAALDLIGTLPDSLEANAAAKIGYIGTKRYLRVVITRNSGTSVAAGAVVIKGNAAERPVT